MKKNILLAAALFFTLGVTACGQTASPQTQAITSSKEELSSGSSNTTIPVETPQDTKEPVPAAGESVPITNSNSSDTQTSSSVISQDEAKKIALDHAQVSESEVFMIQVKLDTDDGVQEYEVEFYVENKEYDYDIDASTGMIRSFDFEIENDFYSPKASGNNRTNDSAASISEEDAKKIALEKVPGAGDSQIRIKTDYDDGQLVYEGKIVYEEIEYEFEIDAATGTILEWDSESIYD